MYVGFLKVYEENVYGIKILEIKRLIEKVKDEVGNYC